MVAQKGVADINPRKILYKILTVYIKFIFLYSYYFSRIVYIHLCTLPFTYRIKGAF